MANKRRIKAGQRVKEAISELEKALETEMRVVNSSGRSKRLARKKIRNSLSCIPVHRMRLAQRLDSYGAKEEAEELFPGHESLN